MPVKPKNHSTVTSSRLQEIPIAIIGLSAIFPQSQNLQAYWDNIFKEVDCITDVPPSRWQIADYYDPDPTAEDKTYSKRGGFIPDIDFDPMEFGLPPNILEVTDVHQLLALILAKEVLRDGGYENPTDEQRRNTGVILGVGGGQKLMIPLISRLQYPIWERVLKNSGLEAEDVRKIVEKIKKAYVGWEENAFPGALGNIIAGRIANRLDLGGTNCVVDAACASSLSGIRMAIGELLDYRADMIISGGIDTDSSPYMYLCFSKTHAFSPKEKSQPFDTASSGMIMGEGIGMVLLKRLADAERDKDHIYAVIRGNGSSSDGRFKSIYAPRPEGQIMALQRAYQDAGISPASIGLLEAHGTGTAAGDLAEMKALNRVFSEHVTARQVIPMGSVKSQIGHTKNAAGAAGIVKTTMALYHRVLPATINIDEPNPDLDFENSPFYLNTEMRPWFHPVREYPRRAAISAFGFGGTNFHFILEDYPRPSRLGFRRQTVAQPILLHAADPEALLAECRTAIPELEGEDRAVAFRRLADRNADGAPPPSDARLGFVAENAEEAVRLLTTAVTTLTEKAGASAWSLNEGLHYRRSGFELDGKVVALFSGQGSPYLNMGKELSCNFPPLMDLQTEMDMLFVEDGLAPLSSIVFPIPTFDKALKQAQAQRLQLTENAQPAIGAFSAGLFRLFQDAGFKPDFVAGHSFGELTALWAASVLDTDDYLRLAKARGKAMAAPDDPDFDAGGMLAVMGELEKLETDIKDFSDITIANLNSRNQVVLAGPKESVTRVQKHLKAKKYRTVLLGVSAAFHTPLVGHAQKPFAQAIQSARFNKPQCRVYSNATGKPYPKKPQEIQQRLQEHILNSVRFKDEIENIHADGGFCFIEFGPQNILTRLVDNILQDKPYLAVALNAGAKQNSDRQFRDAVVQLRVAGLALGPIDPYEYRPVVTERKKTALTLRLSGMNYVSPKTRESFEAALQDGHQIRPLSTPTVEPPPSITPQTIPMNKSLIEPCRPVDGSPEPTGYPTPDLERINQNLESFQNHQNETIHLHEQFLETQSEYARSFFQIMQQQIQAGPAGLSPDITRSIQQFHQHQGDTLRLHEQYLQTQTEFSRNAFELIRQQMAMVSGADGPTYTTIRLPAPARPTPPPVPHATRHRHQSAPVAETPPTARTVPPAAPVSEPVPSMPAAAVAPSRGLTREKLTDTLLAVVSEKTGYQSQMLEMTMDMEADLGIDSIKRVEILNGIQERLPDLPPVNPEELSELRTLGQIIDHMTTAGPATADFQPSPAPTAPVAVPSITVDRDRFVGTLLAVVSEKTGYQPEMLELGMDMEADLGIDSIKRVEILNGIQEKLPDLPPVNPEELSELRTLGQIVDHLNGTARTAAPTPPELSTGTAPANDSPVAAAIDQALLTRTLLQVVSEKTGYQPEMLELGMDMEADLGIDSIKRVEILNGIQEKLPHLPEVNPEELSELRTLAQIVEKMGEVAGTPGSVAEPSVLKKKLKN